MALPSLPEEPFWTYRGVAESIDRLRRKAGGLLASHDYEVYRAGRSEYPDRKTIRQILGAGGRVAYDVIPKPSPSPWTRAEDVYLQAYAHRRSVRDLAWRLGRSPRAVRRRLRRIRIDLRLGYVQPHVLDLILGFRPGEMRQVAMVAGAKPPTHLGLSEADLPQLIAHLHAFTPQGLEYARRFIERQGGPPMRRHVRYWGTTLLYIEDDILLVKKN